MRAMDKSSFYLNSFSLTKSFTAQISFFRIELAPSAHHAIEQDPLCPPPPAADDTSPSSPREVDGDVAEDLGKTFNGSCYSVVNTKQKKVAKHSNFNSVLLHFCYK